jgi:microcystin-dependent protein
VAQPFLGQIMLFGGNFAPSGWALCNGQLLAINQNTALFSLLGTQYGGNGTSNFALPDLRGRAPIHSGQGPGLANYVIGQAAGTETVTLTQAQMPQHNHLVNATEADQTTNRPATAFHARGGFYAATSDGSQMAPQSLSLTGSGLPHEKHQPYLVMTYCIALAGIFPSRN